MRPIRGKYSRASHKQRQAATKLTTFMTGIRSFMKACAILWQKLYARFSEHTFDQGNRALVSRVATHLDIPDRVSMRSPWPGPEPSIQHSDTIRICALVAAERATVTCDQVTPMITMSPNQWGIQ